MLPEKKRSAIIKSLSPSDLATLKYAWKFWAREAQRTPPGDWINWLLLAGRGFGKSRVGKEAVREKVYQGKRRIALVGATQADTRKVMVEGDAETPGLLDVFPPNERPVYLPSRNLVKFHTGALGFTYSAEKSGRLRGPQHDFGWCDELAAWEEAGKGRAQRTWDMFKMGLRIGKNPQCVVTTTPKPIKLIKDLVKDPSTIVTRGSTIENAANLAGSFLEDILRLYKGTRLGRQELEAEILLDVEGALWTLAVIEAFRVRQAPEGLQGITIGVDPSVAGKDTKEDGKTKRDDCGIIVSGRLGPKKPFAHRYVLGEYTLNAAPPVWAVEVVRAYWMHGASAVYAEQNNGGDLVRMAIHGVDPRVNVKLVTAIKDKSARAEITAMRYSRGEIHHIGVLPKLEEELTTWVPDGSSWSPNSIDALNWSCEEDMITSSGGVYV